MNILIDLHRFQYYLPIYFNDEECHLAFFNKMKKKWPTLIFTIVFKDKDKNPFYDRYYASLKFCDPIDPHNNIMNVSILLNILPEISKFFGRDNIIIK